MSSHPAKMKVWTILAKNSSQNRNYTFPIVCYLWWKIELVSDILLVIVVWSLFMYWRFIVQNPLQFYWEDRCSTYYLDFSLENHLPSQVLKDFSVENLETAPITFPLKLMPKILFSQAINCVSIYTLYH